MWSVFRFGTAFLFSLPEAVDRFQQMAIADLAFTNAKTEDDLDGQVAALIYRALERNTEGSFAVRPHLGWLTQMSAEGAKSAPCTSMEAVNPEIAALQQMQDPISTGATSHNHAVILELSRQISIVGGDPFKALDAVPDDASDAPGAGHQCNESDCIYPNKRSQFAISSDEITRYVVSCVATSGSSSIAPQTPAEPHCHQTATIAITTAVSNPWYEVVLGFTILWLTFFPTDRLIPMTAPVQNSNNGYTNTDTSSANSYQTSYTPPTITPAPTPLTTTLLTDINKNLHNFAIQRAYFRPQSEAVRLGGIPAPAAHGSHTTIGEPLSSMHRTGFATAKLVFSFSGVPALN